MDKLTPASSASRPVTAEKHQSAYSRIWPLSVRTESGHVVFLERAERQGLFVVCTMEKGQRIYHCHPTLQKLFQKELHQHEQERACTLHRRAAYLYAQAYSYQAALAHALEAGIHVFLRAPRDALSRAYVGLGRLLVTSASR